jgi:hypothetical protein
MSKQFDKIGAVNSSLRVGLAQATADLVQDQMEETVTLVAEVAEQAEQAATNATSALSSAQQAATDAATALNTATEALGVASSLSGLPEDVVQQIIDLLEGGGTGGGTGGGLEGVQRVGPGAGHWGVTNLDAQELILSPAGANDRWLGGINRGGVDPDTGTYYSVQDYVYRSADLGTGVVQNDAVVFGWDSSKNLYRHILAVQAPSPLGGFITVLLSAGRNAESSYTLLANPLIISPIFAEVSLLPPPAAPESLEITGTFAYPNRAVAGANLSAAFLPYNSGHVILVGPSGEASPLFITTAQPLAPEAAGLNLRMTQGVLIPGTADVLSVSWNSDPSLVGALVRISTDFTQPSPGVPVPVTGGVVRIYNDKSQLVQTREIAGDAVLRLITSLADEATSLAANPSAIPLATEDAHREAVFDPSSGAMVLVPANDRHVYLILWNAESGTAEVERHPIAGVGQLHRKWKWGAAVYVPDRQAVVCAPAAHTHLLEISGKGTAFRTRSLMAFPAPADDEAILFSDIVLQDSKIHLIPRELSSSRIISINADFDPDEPYLVTL